MSHLVAFGRIGLGERAWVWLALFEMVGAVARSGMLILDWKSGWLALFGNARLRVRLAWVRQDGQVLRVIGLAARGGCAVERIKTSWARTSMGPSLSDFRTPIFYLTYRRCQRRNSKN